MSFAWDSYKKYAWGFDELKPKSKKGYNWLGMAVSIVDSLDTLWLMEMESEYIKAESFVEKMNFSTGGGSLFEINIRVLGGLLSIHSLTQKYIFLKKAKELGDVLLEVKSLFKNLK